MSSKPSGGGFLFLPTRRGGIMRVWEGSRIAEWFGPFIVQGCPQDRFDLNNRRRM